MNPTLRQMRAFVALAKTGNFTLAAQYLHVTQSALSGLIKELEQTLGVRVVDRSTRKISLTETGHELYPLFSQIIDDLDSALTNIADHAKLKKGIVRFAAPQLLSCTLLPEVISDYRNAYPEIVVRLADCGEEHVIARVLSGATDFGVGPQREPTPRLEARELFNLPFVLVCPPGHPLATYERVSWKDIAACPFISQHGTDLPAVLHDLPLRPVYDVTFMTTALAMVSAGLGITVCLPYAAALVARHGLVTRPLHEPQQTRRYCVYTRAQQTQSRAATSFIAFLFDQVETRGWIN